MVFLCYSTSCFSYLVQQHRFAKKAPESSILHEKAILSYWTSIVHTYIEFSLFDGKRREREREREREKEKEREREREKERERERKGKEKDIRAGYM